MATSLTGLTPGAPDNTYQDLLHTVAETRATGAQAAWGDGTASALILWETGIGVKSAGGFVSRINTDATAARTLTLPDAAGTLVLGDGTGITNTVDFRAGAGMLSAKLGVDTANATTVAAAVAGFTVGSLKASTTYHFKMVLRAQSAAAATGMRMKITGPAETESVIYHWRDHSNQFFTGAAFGTEIPSAGFFGANVDELILIEGLLVTTGAAPTSPVGLQIWSETDTVAVTLKAGSLLTLTEY
jgi:hypothetical protein